jgi:hypothetical protein
MVGTLTVVFVVLLVLAADEDARNCRARGGHVECRSLTGISYRGDPVVVTDCRCEVK